MIHPISNNDIDTFICYRHHYRIVATQLKKAMENDKRFDYGKVWVSDSEPSGNYIEMIDPLLESAETVLLILGHGFLTGLLDEDKDEVNDNPLEFTRIGVTAKELQRIEVLREKGEIKIIAINVDGYSFSSEDMKKLVKILLHDPEVKASEGEIIKAWAFQNLNNLRFEDVVDLEKMDSFLQERLSAALHIGLVEPTEKLTFFREDDYKDIFYQLLSCKDKYPNVAYFGYAGGVFFKNLFTYSFSYEKQNSEEYAHKNIRILLRDPLLEAKEEREQEVTYAKRTRKKSLDMMTLYNQAISKNEGIRIEIRFYEHTPFIKGCLFCDESWNPLVGIINFESAYGKSYQNKGGSPFKGIDSDMIYFNGLSDISPDGKKKEDNQTMKALATLISQFNYEWGKGKKRIRQNEVCSPLHLVLQDPYYPLDGELKATRECVRGVVMNEAGEIALHYVHRDDKYGNSFYYELPGGGAENGEEPFEALEREIEEEMGFSISRLAYLGDCKDAYNLSLRYNHHHFFLVKGKRNGEKHYASVGDTLIVNTAFYPLEEAISLFEKQEQKGFGGLVRQRELPFLRLAKSIIDNGYIE